MATARRVYAVHSSNPRLWGFGTNARKRRNNLQFAPLPPLGNLPQFRKIHGPETRERVAQRKVTEREADRP